MAHKTTGTKNQDKVTNPQINESPDDKGFAQQKRSENEGNESIYVEQPVNRPNQENLQNRGVQEDQPNNPVRSTGSMASDQQKDKYRQPGDHFAEDADKISS